jgi:DNA (cytosine-5)-methyltransferase 1
MMIGSLCSGYGGLDKAVQAVLGGTLAWVSEYEPPTEKNPRPSQAAARVLAHRYPDVPNLGDMTAVTWSAVAPVDVLTGGTPCQDVSHAGPRTGMVEGTRSNLWRVMADAIDALRPRLVVWENVKGVLSARADSGVEPCPVCVGDGAGPALRALGRVLGDLAELGYDAEWVGLPASAVGAPHERFRVFVAAYPRHVGQQEFRAGRHGAELAAVAGDQSAAANANRCGRQGWPREAGRQPVRRAAATGHCEAAPDATRNGRNEGGPEPAGQLGRPDAAVRRDEAAPDPDRDAVRVESVTIAGSSGAPIAGRGGAAPAHADSVGPARLWRVDSVEHDPHGRGRADVVWGPYEPAIRRWELILGRPAPHPRQLNRRGTGEQLSPRFSEWMMGLPEGWVTDVPGLSRDDQLHVLGNGVVPQQGAAALSHLLRGSR